MAVCAAFAVNAHLIWVSLVYIKYYTNKKCIVVFNKTNFHHILTCCDTEHLQPGQASPSEAFILVETTTGQSTSISVHKTLQKHNREQPLPVLHSVVCKLHSGKQEGRVLGG